MTEPSETPMVITIRKRHVMIPMSSQEWHEPLAPQGPPRFRWPDFTCGYEFSDDYYSEGHACRLPVWHVDQGIPHRAVLEWETRPRDVCRWQGHEWGEWEALPERRNGDPYPFTKKPPTKQRQCARCTQREDDGEYAFDSIAALAGESKP